MAYEGGKVEAFPRKDLETGDTDDMRSQGHLSDRLTVEIDCPSLGPSECPSMASSFSPLDSPTQTPTSMYSHGALASPGWQDGGAFAAHQYDRHSGATPLRNAFRLADMSTTGDSMAMPYAMDTQDRMPMPEYLPGYDDNVEQFWIPSDMPKTYDSSTHGLPYQSTMPSYPQMARSHYRHASSYLPESATNPCLSRPIFSQPERVPNLSTSMSMNNMLPWIPSTDSMPPQTITPSQAFQAPVTPPPSYSDFPASFNTLGHTPNTPVRSCSLGTPSGTTTPISRISGSAGDYQEDFPMSPYRDAMRMQRQPSRKVSKKSSKQNLTLESLPSIIKQVQFKCKEPGCKGRFKRQEHLKRHMKSHSQEKPHVCWVPGCHRKFSRSDNLNAHYTKTHSKRGGRNRYVATLDETSPDYDPDFRGQLTPDGRPIYGSKLEDPMIDAREESVDAWN